MTFFFRSLAAVITGEFLEAEAKSITILPILNSAEGEAELRVNSERVLASLNPDDQSAAAAAVLASVNTIIDCSGIPMGNLI